MSTADQITLYSGLFYVFLAVAIIGLGLAIFLFFFFDIRSVHALMTGKAKRQTIERMAEQNSKTGRLRQPSPLSENFSSAPSASDFPVASANMDTAPLSSNAETAVLRPDTAETSVLSQQSSFSDSPVNGATTPLSRQSATPTFDIRFDVSQTVILIHTDEII